MATDLMQNIGCLLGGQKMHGPQVRCQRRECKVLQVSDASVTTIERNLPTTRKKYVCLDEGVRCKVEILFKRLATCAGAIS
jgi:hypothetical protein